jgi:hypothetical protein
MTHAFACNCSNCLEPVASVVSAKGALAVILLPQDPLATTLLVVALLTVDLMAVNSLVAGLLAMEYSTCCVKPSHLAPDRAQGSQS